MLLLDITVTNAQLFSYAGAFMGVIIALGVYVWNRSINALDENTKSNQRLIVQMEGMMKDSEQLKKDVDKLQTVVTDLTEKLHILDKDIIVLKNK